MTSVNELDRVVIRFAGDSGDGMQLTGDRFTQEAAVFGNDLSTLPNFPAEIRAPHGTIPGVSSFQLHFANYDILTPGDRPDVLVAMNPAALKANVADLPKSATIIVDTHDFTQRNLDKAGYCANPLEDGSLEDYQLHPLDLTGMTVEAVNEFGLSRKDAARSKNMFALGLVSWLYGRDVSGTEAYLGEKFGSRPAIRDANLAALRAGWNFGETTETFAVSYVVKPAPAPPGTYRNIAGNTALSYGVVAASRLSGLPVLFGAYPITPASDILHELSKHRNFGVSTFQAEDEIAAVGAAIGASFAGVLGVTATSGPGVSLKSEAIGLAVMTELPLLVIDVQRGGPSTGLPTKTEQADLLQAMYGRNGEAPVPVVAPQSPSDCFDAAIEAARIAITYRTPVMLLSDGYLANGSEPWRIPEVDQLPAIDPGFATAPNHLSKKAAAEGEPDEFWPYLRDEDTLARPWAVPGTAGLEHRIGGLEKGEGHGNISYDPANHDLMVRTRAAKVERIADSLPPLEVDDPSGEAKVLVIGWGSTYGPIGAACRRVRRAGYHVAQTHLRHLNPFPKDLGDILRRYERVVCPEMNLGQLATMLRDRYLVDVKRLTQVRGLPFGAEHLSHDLLDHVTDLEGGEVMTTADLGLPSLRSGTESVPRHDPADGAQTGKEFTSDQEVRWCPGCGDYAVLKAVQSFLPDLGLRRENIVFVSGIGCSSRFPYYLDTYGMHSIHGRAPSIATGIATAREDLSVWVVTGDGDALAIGGNHLIHALRRNINMTILLFNNRIYGLTKGQYSPTSEVGKVTKSTPAGSLDHPFNPVSLALGAEGSFVARTIDSDRKHLTGVLAAAAAHRGTSFVEIYQNCPIFNDGAFDALKKQGHQGSADSGAAIIPLEHAKPITFGTRDEETGLGDKALTRAAGGGIDVVETASAAPDELLVHDAHNPDPSTAFAISRLTDSGYLNRSPIGIFRQIQRPTYDDLARQQAADAVAAKGEGDLQALLDAADTWTVD